MKYYVRLFKRKKFITLIASLLITAGGSYMVYVNLFQYIVGGLKESGVSSYTILSNGIVGLLSGTNIGLAIIGFIVIYVGLIFIPMNSIDSQNEEDYFLEDRDDFLYIKCFDREFLVKKETFGPTDLFFRDKNKKFVSMAKGYQIYNFITMEHNELTQKAINKSKEIINKEEISKKFKNIKKMTLEEKQEYIKLKKIKNKTNIKCFILAILCFMLFLIIILSTGELIKDKDISFTDFLIIVGILTGLFFGGKALYKKSKKEKKLYFNIMNKNMYYVNCFSYDKKISKTSDGDGGINIDYYIKITDGNYVYNHWFEISEALYNSADILNIKLVLLDETAKYILEIIDNYENII